MAMTPVALVELDGISGQKFLCDRADRRKPCTQQQMGVIGDQSLGKTIGMPLSQYLPQSSHKSISIGIVTEIFLSFDSAKSWLRNGLVIGPGLRRFLAPTVIG